MRGGYPSRQRRFSQPRDHQAPHRFAGGGRHHPRQYNDPRRDGGDAAAEGDVSLLNPSTTQFFADLAPGGGRSLTVSSVPANNFVTRRGEAESYHHHDNDGLEDDEDFQHMSSASKGKSNPISGKQTQDSILWLELGLCKALTRAVAHLGFIAPTPVQTQAIPAIMSGVDCCVRAVTGSGKTAAFVLPMLHHLLTTAPRKQSALNAKRRYIRGLILVPSRELGVQCHEMTKQLMQFTTEVRIALAIGGLSAQVQEAALEQAPELLVATPGRLVDILHNYRGAQGGIDLSGVEMICLDECDKMLTVTLRPQVLDILERIPPETRQLLLFSATMTSEVDEFAKEYLFEAKNVDIGHVALASQLRQQFVRIQLDGVTGTKKAKTGNATPPPVSDDAAPEAEAVDGKKKKRLRSKRLREEGRSESAAATVAERSEAELLGPTISEHVTKVKTRYLVVLCEQYFKQAVLIFTKYRTTAHRLQKVFACLGLKSAELQGNQLQEERFEALRQFAAGEVAYLFCTDVASRGLDIKGVRTVVNFDLPPTLTAYIHRVGRTARIGATGTAVSLVHETVDAEIMRKILTVSGNINEHQVASVKRRDVPSDLLDDAVLRINQIFPRVKEILQAESLAEKIALAEKKLSRDHNDPRATAALADAVIAKPKRQWCLSKKERQARDEEARKKYETEAEVVIEETKQELAALSNEETRFLQRQKTDRRVARERKQQQRERELAKAKELRKKQAQKIQAGNVKALKKKKIREARKEQRAASREKNGRPAFKHGDGKKRNKKSRHSRRQKKH